MNLQSIHSLLRQKTGLDPERIGEKNVERAVGKRMRSTGSENISGYGAKLYTSEQEWAEFIEEVVVPETWFFRDVEPFQFLKTLARQRHQKNPDHKIQILSVPCSSGEEPFSIAIALFEAGFQARHFHIDAIDISRNAIRKAMEGLFQESSFRGPNLAYRDLHFLKTENGYQLHPQIRNAVTFSQKNMLQGIPGEQRYDLIFCRNLLIYMDQQSRRHLVQMLFRLLKADGLLFTGHAETGSMLTPYFQAIPPYQAFTHQRNEPHSHERH